MKFHPLGETLGAVVLAAGHGWASKGAVRGLHIIRRLHAPPLPIATALWRSGVLLILPAHTMLALLVHWWGLPRQKIFHVMPKNDPIIFMPRVGCEVVLVRAPLCPLKCTIEVC